MANTMASAEILDEVTANWSQQFWAQIEDPQTGHLVYINPVSGECRWSLQAGTFVLPRNPDGEWWEMEDTSTGLSYYYNTASKETVWERPENATIIPLQAVQKTSLGRRFSRQIIPTTPWADQPTSPTKSAQASESDLSESLLSSPSLSPTHSPAKSRTASSPPTSPSVSTSSRRDSALLPSFSCSTLSSATSYTTAETMIRISLDSPRGKKRKDGTAAPPVPALPSSFSSPKPYTTRKRSAPPAINTSPSADFFAHKALPSLPHARQPRPRHKSAALIRRKPEWSEPIHSESVPSSSAVPRDRAARTRSITGPVALSRDFNSSSQAPSTQPSAASAPSSPKSPKSPAKLRRKVSTIFVDESSNAKRFSTGMHQLLPTELRSELIAFTSSEFAHERVAKPKTGLFRRAIPLADLLVWQAGGLTAPLLNINKTLRSEAVQCFRLLQQIMGDRPSAMFYRRRGSKESTSTVNSMDDDEALDEDWPDETLLDVRTLCDFALCHGELRDELYMQLIKQLSNNSQTRSKMRGWRILQIYIMVFPPSKDFEQHLQNFISSAQDNASESLLVISQFCQRRLAIITKKGPRGRNPPIDELRCLSKGAFNPNVFLESLPDVLSLQALVQPDLAVPACLIFLANGILASGGLRAEGIFRVPADVEAVNELRYKIDSGFYELEESVDVYTLASLFKLFFRDLAEPLVPAQYYTDCLRGAEDESEIYRILLQLPILNRRVLAFLISFLQLFMSNHVINLTKMSLSNLAMIWAPNILRSSSHSLNVVFTNARVEYMFVMKLLEGCEPSRLGLQETFIHPIELPEGPLVI